MRGLLISNLKRAFLSKWYVISILATVLMCYVSSRDYIGDGTNSVYIMDLMLNLGMFKKIIVFFSAMPFATVYCQDYNSGYIKSLVIRGGEKAYVWSNVIVCAVAGFSAVFLGMLLFFTGISTCYPPQVYEIGGVYSKVACNAPVLYVVLLISVFSFYAVMWTIAGLTVSSMLPDNYVALGSPLILGYLLEEMTFHFPPYMNLYRLSHCADVFAAAPAFNYFYIIGVFAFLIVILGCVFSHFVKRRSRNEMV